MPAKRGIGAVVFQEDSHGNPRPVYFASWSLTDTEKNYTSIEQEALATNWACVKFGDYVLGTKFTIETDHQPLVSLLSITDLSKCPRILQSTLRLMRYLPEVKCIQGVCQKRVDALHGCLLGSRTKVFKSWKRRKNSRTRLSVTYLP